jgi:hypothetical protein
MTIDGGWYLVTALFLFFCEHDTCNPIVSIIKVSLLARTSGVPRSHVFISARTVVGTPYIGVVH